MHRVRIWLAALVLMPAVARADEAECQLNFEDRSQPAWSISGVAAPTEEAARAKALAALCDPLSPADRAACREGAKRGRAWDVEQRGDRYVAELVVPRPKSELVSGARGKTHEAACRAALVKACALVGAKPATYDFNKPACQGTKWFCVGTSNTALEPGTYAHFR